MRYITHILIACSLAFVLFICHRRNLREGRWEQHRMAMNALKSNIPAQATINCQADSAHIFDYLQCRYWLVPARVFYNHPQLDIQLVLRFGAADSLAPQYRKLAEYHTADTHYYLVKSIH